MILRIQLLLTIPVFTLCCMPTVPPERTTTVKPSTTKTIIKTTTTKPRTTTKKPACATCQPLKNTPKPITILASGYFGYEMNERGCLTTVNRCPQNSVLRLTTDKGDIITIGNPRDNGGLASKINLICNNGKYKLGNGTVITENICYTDPCLTCPAWNPTNGVPFIYYGYNSTNFCSTINFRGCLRYQGNKPEPSEIRLSPQTRNTQSAPMAIPCAKQNPIKLNYFGNSANSIYSESPNRLY